MPPNPRRPVLRRIADHNIAWPAPRQVRRVVDPAREQGYLILFIEISGTETAGRNKKDRIIGDGIESIAPAYP